jgi:hypothetical protein
LAEFQLAGLVGQVLALSLPLGLTAFNFSLVRLKGRHLAAIFPANAEVVKALVKVVVREGMED